MHVSKICKAKGPLRFLLVYCSWQIKSSAANFATFRSSCKVLQLSKHLHKLCHRLRLAKPKERKVMLSHHSWSASLCACYTCHETGWFIEILNAWLGLAVILVWLYIYIHLGRTTSFNHVRYSYGSLHISHPSRKHLFKVTINVGRSLLPSQKRPKTSPTDLICKLHPAELRTRERIGGRHSNESPSWKYQGLSTILTKVDKLLVKPCYCQDSQVLKAFRIFQFSLKPIFR